MYVLEAWTFTPGPEGAGTIEVPGVYAIEQFASITNLTRNIPLFTPEEHEATITVTDDGVSTTLTLQQNTSFCQSSDELQIVMYDLFSDPGATSNVAVTNFPATQAVTEGLSVPAHDYVSLSYTDGNVTSVVYKSGGAAGTTVATVSMTYDGSGNLLTVTKS